MIGQSATSGEKNRAISNDSKYHRYRVVFYGYSAFAVCCSYSAFVVCVRFLLFLRFLERTKKYIMSAIIAKIMMNNSQIGHLMTIFLTCAVTPSNSTV